MIHNSQPNIEGYIRAGIEKFVKEEFDRVKKSFIEDLDRRKDEICTGILLNVTNLIQYERMGENIIVTIKKIQS